MLSATAVARSCQTVHKDVLLPTPLFLRYQRRSEPRVLEKAASGSRERREQRHHDTPKRHSRCMEMYSNKDLLYVNNRAVSTVSQLAGPWIAVTNLLSIAKYALNVNK